MQLLRDSYKAFKKTFIFHLWTTHFKNILLQGSQNFSSETLPGKKLNLMIHRTPIAQYLNHVVYTELGLSPSVRVSIRHLWQFVPL